MRSKSIVFAITATLLLGLFGAPASANKVKDKDAVAGGVKDSGTFTGTAAVGKFRTFCTHAGDSDVHGPGLGLPTQQLKNAYYSLTTRVTSTFKSAGEVPPTPDGTLRVCGRLTKMHSAVNGGLGAACGASKGWDGKGVIDWDNPNKVNVWLKNLEWKVSVGGTLPVTGEANQSATEGDSKTKGKRDFVTATVQAQGGADCLTKVDGPTKHDKQGGARAFTVVGNYEIANKVTGLEGDQNVGPECKEGAANGCLNDPKKPGNSG